MQFRESLTFDDVMLVPKHSKINSRSEVDVSVELNNGLKFNIPVVPANMKHITGFEMANTLYEMKGLSILHRYDGTQAEFDILKQLKEKHGEDIFNYVGISIGIKENDKKALKEFVDYGVKIVNVDTANGHNQNVLDFCSWVKKTYPQLFLIGGNVATYEGAFDMYESGVDMIRVGIGQGSLCRTRVESGNGVGTLTSLIEAKQAKDYIQNANPNRTVFIMNDGGMSEVGHMVKALCFSDLVMSGNMFASSSDTPGDIFEENGKKYKRYDGSSTVNKTDRIEGVQAKKEYKGETKDVMKKILQGIQSGCSYQGANKVSLLQRAQEFVKITHNGLKESNSHDVEVIS